MQVKIEASRAPITNDSVFSVREDGDQTGLDAKLMWAAFLASLLMLFVKSPDALLLPQFWAEDGAVFFSEQQYRAWPPMLKEYAGYLHFAPRLIAWLGSLFPIEHQPLIYNSGAMLVDATAITYVACRLRAVMPIPVVVLSFFVLPTAGDIFGTATNVQWFLQFAVFIACIRFNQDCTRLKPAWQRFSGGTLLLVAALSGPFSLLAVIAVVGALVVFRLADASCSQPADVRNAGAGHNWFTRGICPWAVLVVAIGAAAQVVAMLGSTVATPEAAHLLPWERLAQLGVPPQRHAYLEIVGNPWRIPHMALWGLMLVGLLAGMVRVVQRPDWTRAVMFGMVCMGAVQPFLAFAKQNAMHTLSSPSHYFYLWGVVSVWIVVAMLPRRFMLRSWLVPAAMAGVIAVGLFRFPDYFRRSALAQLDWPGYAKKVAASRAPTVVPLNPLPWYMVVQPIAVPRGDRP